MLSIGRHPRPCDTGRLNQAVNLSKQIADFFGKMELPPRRVAGERRLSGHCVLPTGRGAVQDGTGQIPGVIVLAKGGRAEIWRNGSP